jgi:hypothetical protein
LKILVIWDVTPCILVYGTYILFGTMLNSGHNQPLSNTCVAPVAAVSDCRRTSVTNDRQRIDRVLSYLDIVYDTYIELFSNDIRYITFLLSHYL